MCTELLHLKRCRANEFGGLTERLVEGQLLEHRNQGSDGVEHSSAGNRVHRAAGRQHHRRHTDQPSRLVHRHRRTGPKHPGLVAGAGHHAAPAQSPDQNRPTPQRRAGELLHGREERVHVEVQHPALGHGPDSAPFGDRHPHPVADLDAVGRFAELEAGGQHLPGDQIAMGAGPVGPFGRHRHRHADPIADVQTR